jgi:hypothetical protein
MPGFGRFVLVAIAATLAVACAAKSTSPSDTGIAGATPGACGAPGAYCCADGTCQDGGCCVRGMCLAEGTTCGAGVGQCQAGQCGDCGEPGQACCPGPSEINCSDPESCDVCNSPDFDCYADFTCQPCGHDGERCCIDGCWDTPSVCLQLSEPAAIYKSTCSTQCGQAGEPCCSGSLCTDDSCCLNVVGGPYTGTCVAAPTCGCSDRQCTTCGEEGLPCCDGSCVGALECGGSGSDTICAAPRKR